MITFDVSVLDRELLAGLRELAPVYGFALKEGEGILLSACAGEGVEVFFENGEARIAYAKKIHFFRGFGLLLEELSAGKDSVSLRETPQFDDNGAMFDVSQCNAVLRVESVKSILRRMAMMGLNVLMMYCEDSYDVPEEPYFGYMRSRYTEEELRECDDYAYQLGIEMIPCIQTLSHLIDVLKWPVFNDIKEDYETLFVGGDKTYEFVEHLIRAASKPFRTKRIHIGMDEAWHLGTGRYLKEHGLVPGEQIMKEHLARVMEIVRKLGLEPMMWSDMFLRPFGGGDYYSADLSRFPTDAAELVPGDVQTVYWDYYHFDEEFYERFIEMHRVFGEPVFAGGIWTWVGYGANWGITYRTTHPAMAACKKLGIRKIFATIWGDNGTEANMYANMLGLSLFAEHGYIDAFDEEKFKRRFEFCCGAKYDDFYALRLLDEVPGCEKDNLEQVNASKYLMWQDLMTGMFDYHIKGLPLDDHYKELVPLFRAASERNGEYNAMFRFYAEVANVLSLKAQMGLRITEAYETGNTAALYALAKEELPELLSRVEALRSCHRVVWADMNKIIGWDILDMRYGSLMVRIRTAMDEIEDYLTGRISRLEELEEPRRSFNGKEGLVTYANWYGRIVSASRIAPGGVI